jgi:predicted AAA+ superfamily ATPase
MINKDEIKLLIAENQREVQNKSLIERPYIIEDALNYVFVGLRRAGKSYLMYQQIQKLLRNGHSADEILYFNFEDDRLPSLALSDLDLLKTSYEEMYDCRPLFFLDEIQIVAGWEKFARRLADRGYRVFITGSNAKMLSSEIATTLGGRFAIKDVYPFSFPEFLKAQGIDMSDKNAAYKFHSEITKNYEVYFRFGGLPELTKIATKREWLSNLYQKVFFGDLVSRYQIRNDYALRVLVRKLAESVKQPSSFSRLANVVSAAGKKVSTDTTIDYLGYLKESWIIFAVENYCAKLADKESNKKYYFVDNGLLNLFLFDSNTSLLENQVAIRLRQAYGDELHFFQGRTEVDFYLPESKIAIQVAYSMQDIDTRQREMNGLVELSQSFEVKKCLIITKEEEETITKSGVEIQVIPVRKWLLGDMP